LNEDKTDTVTAGATQDVTLTPDAGYVWYVRGLYLNVAAIGGSSGNHYFKIYNSDDSFLAYTIGYTDSTKVCKYDYGAWQSTVDSPQPPDAPQQYNMLEKIRITNDNPLIIRYGNPSDTDQSGQRYIRILVEKHRIA